MLARISESYSPITPGHQSLETTVLDDAEIAAGELTYSQRVHALAQGCADARLCVDHVFSKHARSRANEQILNFVLEGVKRMQWPRILTPDTFSHLLHLCSEECESLNLRLSSFNFFPVLLLVNVRRANNHITLLN